ncbi:MAG: hypothetical protein JWQ00_3124, partial [Noviherbaspirillum sp.]|nr:hypothetical protein [Noviherbaspirillum sp.]
RSFRRGDVPVTLIPGEMSVMKSDRAFSEEVSLTLSVYVSRTASEGVTRHSAADA